MRILELIERHRGFVGDIVIDAVMHDAKADAVEIDDLVVLVVHFGRAVQQLGARGAKVGAAGLAVAS